MKLSAIINAVPAFNKMMNVTLGGKEAFLLHKLIAKLQPDIELFNKLNMEIITKYGGTANDDGSSTFQEERFHEYTAELDALLDADVDVGTGPVQIIFSDNIRLSVVDITTLSPFIEFTEGKNDC